ncbi:MAG TPA: MgtC/SapB family protein, partial [Burkholderiales bacterium]|nr:MgtC/SapB family protein [Burkholderiales bacterium]
MEAFTADWSLQLLLVAEVAFAMLLGGVIGFERELANKPAGFRTHMLVAGASALLVGMGETLVAKFAEDAGHELIQADPFRIIGAVVSGVSFLGAGTIFRGGRQHVEGLTTAASLLISASIGVAVGSRQWITAIGVTLLTLAVLRALVFV